MFYTGEYMIDKAAIKGKSLDHRGWWVDDVWLDGIIVDLIFDNTPANLNT